MNLILIRNSFKKIAAFIALIICLAMPAYSELPTAKEIAGKMKVGWNMGNTLEAICSETVWGGAVATQKLIDSVKAAGFNAIRLPCAWFCHSDTITGEIDEDWMSRVQEVVDYCIDDSLYVILNIHWDTGWLENRVNAANQAKVNERQQKYWEQIAETFIDYDEHLLFAGSNEPNVNNAAEMNVLMSYHQTFIDVVRETGGNNLTRTLVVQGPTTDVEKTYKLMSMMPTDIVEDRLMVEVHYYTPWQFCGMEGDESWGKAFYYWGKDFHSQTDISRNATWGEEKDVEKLFNMMKTKFVDKDIPVIIGEFMAIKRKLSSPSDQELHLASVEYFYKYIVKSALDKGIIPFCWDLNKQIFERSTGQVLDKMILNAIMEGAEDAGTSYVPLFDSKLELYPNPFESSINIKIKKPADIVSISVFDTMGKQVEKFIKSNIKSDMNFGASLRPDLYIVQVCGREWSEPYRIVKR